MQEVETGLSKEMPSKIVLYGVPKIGKSRLCADFPDPFFIDIEGGLSYLGKKVRATPTLRTFEDVMAWLKHIHDDEKFKCGTIIIDSADWLESLAQAKLVKEYNAANINDPAVKEFAYFKGVMAAAEEAIKVIRWLDAIYRKKGIGCVLIAHSQVKSVDLPNQDPYSRHELKLSKWFAAKMNEWADLILFADYSFHVSKDGKTSEPKPVLFAGGSASFTGGGRMLLPKTIPLDFGTLKKALTGLG